MLRAVGVVLILLGCSGMGWYSIMRYSARIRMLAEWEQALQYLYGEIEYSGCDIIELFHQLARRQGSFQCFWGNMEGCLREYDGQGLFVHWERELNRVSEIGCMKNEDRELLRAVGENLGNLDRQTQLHTLDIFQERLRGILLQARQEYQGKAKVCGVAWVTAGLFLALVLV